jgi:hypothetical protein
MNELENELERLLDKHSLGIILNVLTDICHAKAEHVRTNWQDEELASSWEYNAKQLDKVKLY